MSLPYQIASLNQYQEDYKSALENPELFWDKIAKYFLWQKPWSKVLEWNFNSGDIKWFIGAKLNITENCIDRHLEKNADSIALIWEPNNPSENSKTYTYKQLHTAVCKAANALKSIGIKKGDCVCLYMGMIPELSIAILACARIGAIHSVIFGGFSAKSIEDRVKDAKAKFVITCDGAYRGAKEIFLKQVVDEALNNCETVEKLIVVQRTNSAIVMKEGRDIFWNDIFEQASNICPAEIMDAEDILFILYTSGSTGKPKGVVHTCGGYMVWANYSFVNVFQYKPNDVFFCTADIGWITGHSYIIYGPLSAGATTLMFEGVPTWPDAGRLWDIVAKHNVAILYTAPTAIRSLMAYGDSYFENKNLSSLKTLGTVGEPINVEAWDWYNEKVGKKQCPIVDTWWQTETGGILISNLASVTKAIPCWATLPLPGVQPIIVDEKGMEAKPEVNEFGKTITVGNLCIRFPWPGILRTTYGDHNRFFENYFATYPSLYFTGDGCIKDEDGNYRITGRVDDVLNVSGHRIGTAEVESAINSCKNVIESAVVGFPHDIKGQAIYAYVICKENPNSEEEVKRDILQIVSSAIGAIARPDKIQIVKGLPKTRSGKIMRRILRKIAERDFENIGDTSTLLDPLVVDEIKTGRLN